MKVKNMKQLVKIICLLLSILLTACRSEPPQNLITAKEKRQQSDVGNLKIYDFVKYSIPGMEEVTIAQVTYKDALTMDIYYPPKFDFNSRLPTVVFPTAYTNAMIFNWYGLKKFNNHKGIVSWAQLIAASGMIAVTYESAYPYDDVHDAINYISENRKALRIDNSRIGIWACSANPLAALEALTDKNQVYSKNIKCGVLYYPIINQFLQPAADAPVIPSLKKELRRDVPLLLVKAGKEREEWNQAIDLFIEKARALNIPLEYIFYEEGGHGFDTNLDNEKTRKIIQNTIDFIKKHLEV